MKSKNLFSLILLSSFLLIPSIQAKAMYKNIVLGFLNGKPVLNKNLDRVIRQSRYSPRHHHPTTEKPSPLIFDTSHLTGDKVGKNNLGAGSISYNRNGKKTTLIYDPGLKQTIILENNPKNKVQSAFKVKDPVLSSNSQTESTTSVVE